MDVGLKKPQEGAGKNCRRFVIILLSVDEPDRLIAAEEVRSLLVLQGRTFLASDVLTHHRVYEGGSLCERLRWQSSNPMN
jgi:hypothetical protein